MACGAEVAAHLRACPNCGRPVSTGASSDSAATSFPGVSGMGDSTSFSPAIPRSAPSEVALSSQPLATPLTPPPSGALALPTSAIIPVSTLPAGAVPVAPSALPSIGYGDLGGSLLPHDTLGRVVLATVLAMGVDALVPWVVVGGQHVALIRVGAPVLFLFAALAMPILALRPALRKQPLWAATTLALGALFLGAGIGVQVLLSWLAPRVTLIGTSSPSSSYPPLLANDASSIASTYSADVGFYLFLLGAVVLMVTGYQLFLAAREGQPGAVLLRAPGLIVPYATNPMSTPAASTAASSAPTHAPFAPARPATSAPISAPPFQQPVPAPAAPVAPSPPATSGPILPGTAAWNQSQDAPPPVRHSAPGTGLSRPLGPPPGR